MLNFVIICVLDIDDNVYFLDFYVDDGSYVK